MSIKMEFIASKVFLLVGNTGGILDNSWVYSTSYDVTFFFIISGTIVPMAYGIPKPAKA